MISVSAKYLSLPSLFRSVVDIAYRAEMKSECVSGYMKTLSIKTVPPHGFSVESPETHLSHFHTLRLAKTSCYKAENMEPKRVAHLVVICGGYREKPIQSRNAEGLSSKKQKENNFHSFEYLKNVT